MDEPIDLKQPMTLEDFVLLQPIILNEIMAACSISSSEANERQITVANQLLELSYSLTGRNRALLNAVASQIIACEPD